MEIVSTAALAPLLVSPVPLPCRAGKRTADSLVDDDGLWHCSLGCGTLYERSSGRSIRRHMTSCFRSHWPGGQQLSESEVQLLMSTQQESGLLVTGLRRWKKRQSCRAKVDIHEDETWTCPKGCSKVYRLTSSRSIQQHLLVCVEHSSTTDEPAPTANESPTEDSAPAARALSVGDCTRAVEHRSGTLAFPGESPVSVPTTPDSVPRLDIEPIRYGSAHTQSSLASAIPGQFDGTSDDGSFMEESDYSTHALQIHYDDNMQHDHFFSPNTLKAQYPSFAYSWEDTPLRMLLRRHQAEVQQINARHNTEILALHETAAVFYTAPTYSAPLLQAQ